MKLSEAIREGAKLRPQAIIKPFDYNWHAKNEQMALSSCALGAAYEAAVEPDIDEASLDLDDLNSAVRVDIWDVFPELNKSVAHPIDSEQCMDMGDIIGDLNDSHEWTREEIADWLAEQGY